MSFNLWLNSATFRNFKNRKKEAESLWFQMWFYQPLLEERDLGGVLSP